MIPNGLNMPPSTEIPFSADDNTLPASASISTHRKVTQAGFQILPLSRLNRVVIPPGCTSTDTTDENGPKTPSAESNPRKATQMGFTIKQLSLPLSATISAFKSEREARRYDRQRGFTHRKIAPVEFNIVPLQPVDGPADADFGNQLAFGVWLGAEEMDDEISSATEDDIPSSTAPPAPIRPITNEHLQVITNCPTNGQNSRVRGGTTRRAQTTGFKILPLGHPDRMTEAWKAIFADHPNGAVTPPSMCLPAANNTGMEFGEAVAHGRVDGVRVGPRIVADAGFVIKMRAHPSGGSGSIRQGVNEGRNSNGEGGQKSRGN